MKPSRYNIYVDAACEQSFIYNAMANSILVVDNTLRQYLEKGHLEKIDSSVKNSLKKCGIIVGNTTDELKVFRLNYNTAKYNTNLSSFLIFTAYACNLCCPYCYEGPANAAYRSSFMSPETTSEVVQFICNQTVQDKSQAVGVALYGGEPLLNMECCETVLKEVSQWCNHNNVAFSATIMSNGTLFTEKVYARIGQYLSYVHITLDGPQQYHDKKRVKKDGSGTYSQILQNLKQLKNTKEHLSIRINIDEENRHAVGEVLTDLEKIGLKGRPRFHLYFSQIIPQNFCLTFSADPEFTEQHKKASQYFPAITQMAKEQGWGTHLGGLGEHQLVSAGLSCGYVKRGTYAIDPEGGIYICPALAGTPQYKAGKIQNGSAEWYPVYYDILTGDPSLTAPCNTCELLPLCRGGCPIAFYSMDKTQCNSKELLYERLKAYLEFQYPEASLD